MDVLQTRLSRVAPPLPYEAATFDAVISISVFSHLNQASQDAFLEELARITKPGATLMLTIHGEAAMRRARTEHAIFDMIAVGREAFDEAGRHYDAGDYAFILQHGHLTRKAGEAGALDPRRRIRVRHHVRAPEARSRALVARFEVREIVDGGPARFPGHRRPGRP